MDNIIRYYEAVYSPYRGKKKMSTKKSSGEMSQSSECSEDNNPSLEVAENNKLFKERFAALFNNPRLSDIILHVGEEVFYAHRFMLVACSDVFEAMLNEERWCESKQPEITLTELDECVPVFSVFLRYIYTGCIKLTTDNVLSILLLADKYNISALHETCVDYMLHHVVESPDTNRTLSWYQYAKMTANDLLVTKCWKFILSNFDIILKTSDWMNMTKAEVVQFLSSSDLVVTDEFYLWQNVEKWILAKYEEEEVAEIIEEIIPLLRFSMIQPKQLLQIEKSTLYPMNQPVFAEKLGAAYRRYALSSDGVEFHTSGEFRNYTSPSYGICKDIRVFDYKKEHNDGRVLERMSVPIQCMPLTEKKNQEKNCISFEVTLGCKRHYAAFGFYKNPKSAYLSVRELSKWRPYVKAEITFMIYGIKNGVRYVAYTYTNTHQFEITTQVFSEKNLLDLSFLNAEKSPYLIEGDLVCRLFVKVLSIKQDSEQVHVECVHDITV